MLSNVWIVNFVEEHNSFRISKVPGIWHLASNFSSQRLGGLAKIHYLLFLGWRSCQDFFHGRKKLLLTVSADLVATRYLTLKVLKPTLASSFIVLGKCSAGTISLSSQMRIVSFARGMVIFSFSRVSVDLPRHLLIVRSPHL